MSADGSRPAGAPQAADAVSIDVIIPVRNGARYVTEAVQSALNQTLPPRRVIVVDDGSEDDTVAVLSRIDDPRLEVITTPPTGVSHARNTGIAAASADYVAFLDADDLWEPQKLARQMAVLAASPDAAVVHCSYRCINEDGRPVDGNVTPPRLRGDLFEPLLFDAYCLSGSASAVVVRRDCLEAVGGFDEHLFQGEDWDLWIRLASRFRYDFSPEPLTRIRLHSGSAQRRDDPERSRAIIFQHLRIYDKWAGKVRLPRRLAAGILRQCYHQIRADGFSAAQAAALHDRASTEVPNVAARVLGPRRRFVAVMVTTHAAWLVLRYRYVLTWRYMREKWAKTFGKGPYAGDHNTHR